MATISHSRPRPWRSFPRLARLPILIGLLLATPAPANAEERLTIHRAPAPLSPQAIIEPWPRFLGPHDDATTRDAPVDWSKLEAGPIWEVARGSGYANVATADGLCFLFHRLGDEEILEAREVETGRLRWQKADPVVYEDRYGYNNGPRCGPVLAAPFVYTHGVAGKLTCREQATGRLVWQQDLEGAYQTAPRFFGAGASPLVWGDLIVVNAGGSDNRTVLAFDRATGKERWVIRHPWGASYASPVVVRVHGRDWLLVFAGGESDPATGGLLCIDPSEGRLTDAFPWRADRYESVNAVSPVLAGGNRIFLTETYGPGGVMLEIDPKGRIRVAWTAPRFAVHMMQPIVRDGLLLGFDGRHQLHAELVALDVRDGREQWRDPMRWMARIGERELPLGLFRGSLLGTREGVFALGETGVWAVLNPTAVGPGRQRNGLFFHAPEAWTPPALSGGLLFIQQNDRDRETGQGPRLLVYDVRAGSLDHDDVEPGAKVD